MKQHFSTTGKALHVWRGRTNSWWTGFYLFLYNIEGKYIKCSIWGARSQQSFAFIALLSLFFEVLHFHIEPARNDGFSYGLTVVANDLIVLNNTESDRRRVEDEVLKSAASTSVCLENWCGGRTFLAQYKSVLKSESTKELFKRTWSFTACIIPAELTEYIQIPIAYMSTKIRKEDMEEKSRILCFVIWCPHTWSAIQIVK